MLFGSKDDFAIECFHEPDYPNDHGWVFGRMCVWCRDVELGDLSEPACMLNVTEGFFQDCLGRLDGLQDASIDRLPNDETFHMLDSAIYLDDNRPDEQVHADSLRYSKFVFLTGWGESFDTVKAFLVQSGSDFRVLYLLRTGLMGSTLVSRDSLVGSLMAFLEWVAIERRVVPFA